MIVRWRVGALDDLDRFHEWLATIDGADPDRVILGIRARAEMLAGLGDIGRPGGRPGTRELSVRTDPYVIVYRAEGDGFDILAVYHTSQKR